MQDQVVKSWGYEIFNFFFVLKVSNRLTVRQLEYFTTAVHRAAVVNIASIRISLTLSHNVAKHKTIKIIIFLVFTLAIIKLVEGIIRLVSWFGR